MDKKYTIKDIAELAGVSKGTVDRVLHGRGKVSKKAEERIKQVLKEIDYQPNPIARNLKTNKIYTIFVLLPDPKEDSYWAPANDGIKEASKEFKPFGVLVKKFFYHPKKRSSFSKKAEEALDLNPDVLLMAPLFHKESLEIFEKCKAQKILVALFNNYIDVLNTENFIGQDLTQSGRVGASLIDKISEKGSTIMILHIDEEAHMRQKENGFKEFFEEKKDTTHTLITYSLSTYDLVDFKSKVVSFFRKHSNISSVFVTNSKAHLFIDCLGEDFNDISVVGYDLLRENIRLLKNGKIDFLIHQKPKQQAYIGIGNLAEHFLFDKPIPSRKLLPIDIITQENVRYHQE